MNLYLKTFATTCQTLPHIFPEPTNTMILYLVSYHESNFHFATTCHNLPNFATICHSLPCPFTTLYKTLPQFATTCHALSPHFTKLCHICHSSPCPFTTNRNTKTTLPQSNMFTQISYHFATTCHKLQSFATICHSLPCPFTTLQTLPHFATVAMPFHQNSTTTKHVSKHFATTCHNLPSFATICHSLPCLLPHSTYNRYKI